MIETSARLDICVWVKCPHCEFIINLLNKDDTSGHDHNEEGEVLSQACPSEHWSEEHESFEIFNVKCSECHKEFNVKKLEW